MTTVDDENLSHVIRGPYVHGRGNVGVQFAGHLVCIREFSYLKAIMTGRKMKRSATFSKLVMSLLPNIVGNIWNPVSTLLNSIRNMGRGNF